MGFALCPPAFVRLFDLFPRQPFELGEAVFLFRLPRGAAFLEICGCRRCGFAGMFELLPQFGQFRVPRGEGGLQRRQFIAQNGHRLGLGAGIGQRCLGPLEARRRLRERERGLLAPLRLGLLAPAFVRLFDALLRPRLRLGKSVLLSRLPCGAAFLETRFGCRRSLGRTPLEHGVPGRPRCGQLGVAGGEGSLRRRQLAAQPVKLDIIAEIRPAVRRCDRTSRSRHAIAA